MKYMVISDIHGGIDNLNKVLNIYNEEKCSKLLILGDLFDYGIDYHREDIITRLNVMKDNIIAVCGNCDNDMTNIEFNMPHISESNINNKQILLTHGHLYSKDYLLKFNSDIVFIGHSHVYSIERINTKVFVNPGSITKSRRGDNSFALIDENNISIRNLDNIRIEEFKYN